MRDNWVAWMRVPGNEGRFMPGDDALAIGDMVRLDSEGFAVQAPKGQGEGMVADIITDEDGNLVVFVAFKGVVAIDIPRNGQVDQLLDACGLKPTRPASDAITYRPPEPTSEPMQWSLTRAEWAPDDAWDEPWSLEKEQREYDGPEFGMGV